MPSSDQLLFLPNLQRNLLFTCFLESPSLARILESRAAVRNSPAIRNALDLFHTYVTFCNFYAEKPGPWDETDRQMGRLVLDLRGQTLDLLSNLGFCRILVAIPDDLATATVERVLRSLSGPDLAVYLNSGNPCDIPLVTPTRNCQGPNPTNGDGSTSPASDHSSTPPFDVRNPSISGLSALASRITRALVEGRPPNLMLWNSCLHAIYPTFSFPPMEDHISPSTNSSPHRTDTRTHPHSSPMPRTSETRSVPILDTSSCFTILVLIRFALPPALRSAGLHLVPRMFSSLDSAAAPHPLRSTGPVPIPLSTSYDSLFRFLIGSAKW